MTRKSTDLIAPNLRIREALRYRLEKAARKRGVSLNREMTDRLEGSFDLPKLQALETLVERLAGVVDQMAPAKMGE